MFSGPQKLHPSVEDWDLAAAAELAGRTAVKMGKPLENVTEKDILEFYKSADSHFVFEAHLPALVPLAYVDKVLIPKVSWALRICVCTCVSTCVCECVFAYVDSCGEMQACAIPLALV